MRSSGPSIKYVAEHSFLPGSCRTCRQNPQTIFFLVPRKRLFKIFLYFLIHQTSTPYLNICVPLLKLAINKQHLYFSQTKLWKLLLTSRVWCICPEIRQFCTDITNMALTPQSQTPAYWLLVEPTQDWIKNSFPNCFRLIYCYFFCSFKSKTVTIWDQKYILIK